mmetsp:Transcript_105644/g.251905  ORF Transcript_105644/g.251905 Transcript_105644/m.251905 type:complete len:995 (-) Transcript_105644:1353-4337(-)
MPRLLRRKGLAAVPVLPVAEQAVPLEDLALQARLALLDLLQRVLARLAAEGGLHRHLPVPHLMAHAAGGGAAGPLAGGPLHAIHGCPADATHGRGVILRAGVAPLALPNRADAGLPSVGAVLRNGPGALPVPVAAGAALLPGGPSAELAILGSQLTLAFCTGVAGLVLHTVTGRGVAAMVRLDLLLPVAFACAAAAAGDTARAPAGPLAPLGIHAGPGGRAALRAAQIRLHLLLWQRVALGPGALRWHCNAAGPRAVAQAAIFRLLALGPVAPTSPLAVHIVATGGIGGGPHAAVHLPEHHVAAAARRLGGLQNLPLARVETLAARDRALRPHAPVRDDAVRCYIARHLLVAGLRLVGVALARLAPRLRLVLDLSGAEALAAATGGAAGAPVAPVGEGTVPGRRRRTLSCFLGGAAAWRAARRGLPHRAPGAEGLRTLVAATPLRPVAQKAVVGVGTHAAHLHVARLGELGGPSTGRAAVQRVLQDLTGHLHLPPAARLGALTPLAPVREPAVAHVLLDLTGLCLLLSSVAGLTKRPVLGGDLSHPRLLAAGVAASRPGRPVREDAVLLASTLRKDARLGLLQVAIARLPAVVLQPLDLALPRAHAVTCGRLRPLLPITKETVLGHAGATLQRHVFAFRVLHLVGFAAGARAGDVANGIQGVGRRGAQCLQHALALQTAAGATGGRTRPVLPGGPDAPFRLLGALVALSHLSGAGGGTGGAQLVAQVPDLPHADLLAGAVGTGAPLVPVLPLAVHGHAAARVPAALHLLEVVLAWRTAQLGRPQHTPRPLLVATTTACRTHRPNGPGANKAVLNFSKAARLVQGLVGFLGAVAWPRLLQWRRREIRIHTPEAGPAALVLDLPLPRLLAIAAGGALAPRGPSAHGAVPVFLTGPLVALLQLHGRAHCRRAAGGGLFGDLPVAPAHSAGAGPGALAPLAPVVPHAVLAAGCRAGLSSAAGDLVHTAQGLAGRAALRRLVEDGTVATLLPAIAGLGA